ncbi:hypothetical protein HDU76_013958 [Blyttiomyces sp. JEL0837]|nr:hypothetical protein HDU76_013958 [Blyttiomyces sp. JEL0837]
MPYNLQDYEEPYITNYPNVEGEAFPPNEAAGGSGTVAMGRNTSTKLKAAGSNVKAKGKGSDPGTPEPMSKGGNKKRKRQSTSSLLRMTVWFRLLHAPSTTFL